jgi:Ca2+/H+ antiporter, TMEM165/GDT1 family
MSIRALLQAFATVFPAELPDKTMLATVVLVARHRRPGWVWAGAVSAFAVHVVVAVVAGGAIGRLARVPVQLGVAALFLVGAVLLVRAAREHGAEEVEAQAVAASTARATFVGSFGLIVAAEWGDLTQLATAGLAARSGEPLSTGAGALLALAAVAALAATFGRRLIARVPLQKVNHAGAAVFAVLALWTLADLV